ncbi:nucleoside 2-deoxyribosyltransferase [Sulfurimonas autotrophica]|uniref:Nucleoside 2-deoxyribosyltransferase n=1 Tax=Sulfurimonas autotrophica (strain ATCC BAA-671 / DSM 16294 / JCM 11897 / OK10) TaxID=563040 RepID=E0US10_SULAO|nr:nucleoside 2-deoxyribosyltransferase [Sulfurimonas autotrophica]ADN09033.1 nucleoside 2-deoxyribosyltransferase [Sulfurimonas autotrophica DSM 16294]
MKKIYIAGPDVFEQNSIEIGKKLVKMCKKYGYEGLYPLDNVVDFSQSKHKTAQDIFDANIAMIQKADIVIANLNPFRGKEPDSGTVFECGFAYGLKKEVYGYLSHTCNYLDSFNEDEKFAKEGYFCDDKKRLIEDFDYPLNLMLSCSTKILEGDFETVLKFLKGKE